MSTPAQSLRDSITRLSDTMRAAKSTSDEIKGRVAEQTVSLIRIGQEETDEGSDSEQSPTG